MAGKKFLGAGIDASSQRVFNVADPSSSQDAATKNYVDNLVNGLSWKTSVRAATTTNGTLATAYAAASVIDGVTLATGNRILLKNQTAPAENGIYVVAASGAPTRATDADSAAELVNASVFVQEGTVNADLSFVQTTNAPITVNTTGLVFAQVGGSTYTNGNGLSLSGGSFSVLADPVSGGGISVTSSGVKVDASVVVKKFISDVGNGSLTTIPLAHGFGHADLISQLRNKSTGEVVDADITHDATNWTGVFAVAPTSAQYRVVVHG